MKQKIEKTQLITWINQINHEIFDNKIDLSNLKIRQFLKDHQSPDARAWYYPGKNRIDLILKKMKGEFEIFHTLAHELIHVYQMQLGFNHYKLNHGGKFFRYYKRKICNAYEINHNWMF